MPTYVFKCKKCAITFDVQGSMQRPPQKKKCPHCKIMCERYYGSGSANFVLKGDGWPSKNIKKGQSAIAENAFEASDIQRKKMGLKVHKEKPMSDEEFKKKKKRNQEWLDSQPKGNR